MDLRWRFICSFNFMGVFVSLVGCFLFCFDLSVYLVVSDTVFGLLLLPSEMQEVQGPSLSLLWPPKQVDASECDAEVPHLATHNKPIFWTQSGAGTGVAGAFPCALRSLVSPNLLLMSSPSWHDYEHCYRTKQFYESTLFSMWATCK